MSPARRVASEILLELRRNPRSHSDQLLRSSRVDSLSSADRNLATALVMGVLRWGLELDRRILEAAGRRAEPLDDAVEVAIELGALQLWFFDRIPAHAAVFESVELVKHSKSHQAAGLVNAVLRKLKDLPPPSVTTSGQKTPAAIARSWAHPQWLVERWVRAYGLEAAAAICRYDQTPPPVSIRLPREASGQIAAEAESTAPDLAQGALVTRARRAIQGDFRQPAGSWIQDEGSQLVAELGAAARPQTVLDCCAAPGGKLSILIERWPAAQFTAVDIHPARLGAMRRLLSRRYPQTQIDFRCGDLGALDFSRTFDLILLDAPCSGTGTLARNPEIRYRLSAGDLARHQKRQARLLRAAMRALAKGGRLIYSTCSLEMEENEQVFHQAIRGEQAAGEYEDFRILPVRDQIVLLEKRGVLQPGSASVLFPDGSQCEFLHTIPGVHPCDGFFAAMLVRSR